MANGNGTPSAHGTPAPPAAKKANLAEMFDFAAADKAVYRCRWAGCQRTSADFGEAGAKVPRTLLFARHIQTHLPDTSHARASSEDGVKREAEGAGGEKVCYRTLEDERGDAAGVSLGAALVLRNLAKFMPQSLPAGSHGRHGGMRGAGGQRSVNGAGGSGGEEGGEGGMMGRVFGEEVRERLFFALTHGKPIGGYVGSVLRAIARGSDGVGGMASLGDGDAVAA